LSHRITVHAADIRKGGFGGQPFADVISALTNHLLKPIADLEVSGDGAVEIDDLGHDLEQRD
jgi:hypothetical protein